MIYLSQLESESDMRRLTASYGLGLESYEFASGHALDNLFRSVGSFSRKFASLYKNGLSFHGPFLDLNPGSFESMVREATRIRFAECYTAAKLAKANSIVFHTGFYPEYYSVESWERNSVEFWKEFLSDKDDSIRICLENHHDPSPEPIARLLDAVNHPGFCACLDVGHANVWSQLPPKTWIECLEKRIQHLHLNNNDGKRDLHSALDDGTLDIPQSLGQILHTAPCADWVLEIFSVQAVESSLRLIDQCLKTSRVFSASAFDIG